MRVKRANSMGLSFGGLDVSLERAPGGRDARNVTVFGGPVHREAVNAELERLGFRSELELARNLHETQDVLIRTHGISDIRRVEFENARKRLVDTTCPLVRPAAVFVRDGQVRRR